MLGIMDVGLFRNKTGVSYPAFPDPTPTMDGERSALGLVLMEPAPLEVCE